MSVSGHKGSQKARSSPLSPRSTLSQSRSDLDKSRSEDKSSSPNRSFRSSVCSSTLTLEEENDLRQFLKLVRGVEWGMRRRRRGPSDVSKVVEKLKAIGVTDVNELLRRVLSRKINEELSEAGFPRFSKDTLESIRKQSSLIRALEHLGTEANYRQIGALAPAPQMLSSENLVYRASQMPSGLRGSLASPLPPSDGAGGHTRGRMEDSGPRLDGSREAARGFAGMAAEDGLSRFPLQLRGARRRRPRGGLQAMAMSLPDLNRAERPTPKAPGVRVEIDPYSQSLPNTSMNTPSNSKEHGPMRVSVSAGGASEGGRSRHSPTPSESPVRSEGARSRSLSQKVHGPDTPRLMEKLMHASSHITADQRPARWTSLNHSEESILQHGEAMLKEQEAFDARRQLFRQMDAQGAVSPLRRHIAKKIRGRLREEQERDGQAVDAVTVQQRSINIRKHLGLMSNLRRELQVLKRNAFDDEDWDLMRPRDDAVYMRGSWGRGAMKASSDRAARRY